MELSAQFSSFIEKEELFHPSDKLILAVSGGVDSVVLADMCKKAFYNFSIAHCNFQLRGKESERDEMFVRAMADEYGVELSVARFETLDYAEEKKVSIQVAARELRYSWFRELAEKENALVLTAHHADDNIETLLMNFFKGTGINGLSAISSKNRIIIRPLLFAQKKEILSYASKNALAYVEDSSNSEDKYTRNYFRNQLLPAIAEVFPQVESNLISNIKRFTDINILYQEAIDHYSKKLVEVKNGETHIPVLKLQKVKPLATVIYELAKPFGFTPLQTQSILDLLTAPSGKYVTSPTHRILRNRQWLIISPILSIEANTIVIEEEEQVVEFADGSLTFKVHLQVNDFKPTTDNSCACLDKRKITYPLILRHWKQGDYFYPLGMNKKKKLSRFFIDQKLSIASKEKVWVLEMDRKIIWVAGMRIDDRFKITKETNDILEIKLDQPNLLLK